MEYQVVIGRDREAGVWFVRTTNIPGLALEDPSLDNLINKLPDAIAWLLQENKAQNAHEVPFEVLLVEHARTSLAHRSVPGNKDGSIPGSKKAA